MANSNLTPTAVTRRALRDFVNSLAFVKNVDRQYDNQYQTTGAKDGDSLKIRLPNKYSVVTGKTLTISDNIERSVTLNRATQKHVAINFSSKELTTDIEDFDRRILKPAMNQLANNVDADALNMTLNVYNQVGTAGTIPATAQVWLDAAALLDDFGTPRDDMRCALMKPNAMARTVDGLKGLFESGDAIADQYKNGIMKRALGLKWAFDQNVRSVTTGSRTGTILINGTISSQAAATATTSDIAIDGFGGATQTVKAGEVFTIGSVYAVNPLTGESTGALQQFTVVDDETASGSAIAALTISPALRSTGPYKTVDSLPQDGAAITFVGSASTAYAQNLVFHKDAFAFATIDLVMPDGVDMAAREQYDGISLRMVRQYDVNNDNLPARIDILYGYVTKEARFACRVTS